jgi:hypothetical protein
MEHTLHCLVCCSVSLLPLSWVDVIAYITLFVHFTNLDSLPSLIRISEGLLYLILLFPFELLNLEILNLVLGCNEIQVTY